MEINAAAIWLNSAFASFDLGTAKFVHRLAEFSSDFFTPFFKSVSFLAYGGILLILLSLLLILNQPTRRYGTAMLLALGFGVVLTNCVVKILIARPRPYIDQASEYYRMWLTVGQATESDKSFPSGHVTAATAAALAFFLSSEKKQITWLSLLFPLAMCVSRIYLVVHFPSDVLGGVLVGAISGICGVLTMRILPKKYYELNLLPPGTGRGRKPKGGKHCR